MKRYSAFVFVIIGLALVVWQSSLAIDAIMVFKNNEPISSWALVLVSPALVLIGAIVAIFRKNTGAVIVLGAAVIPLTLFLVVEKGLSENVIAFFMKYSVPVIAVGLGILLSPRPNNTRS